MKLIKIRIRNQLDNSVFPEMAIETPEKLSDSDLDAIIISVWNRKPRRYRRCCTVVF